MADDLTTHRASMRRLNEAAGLESGYDALPRAARDVLTPKEYAWLDDAAKLRLVRDLCEPEWAE